MEERGILKGLEQDARLIKERIPMKLDELKIAELAASLSQFKQETSYSGARIGKFIGVSGTVISQFINGKYPSVTDDLLNKITDLLNSHSRRQRHNDNVEFVSTTVLREIETLIKTTDAFSGGEGKCGIIVGDGGQGKTKALEAFAQANKNTIYVLLDQGMHTIRIFAAIAEKLELDSSGSLDSIIRRLITHLQNKHTILMLDEASSLTVKQLDLLRQVIMVKCRIPLILAGNGDLSKTVMQPTTRKGFESLDQFTSRLMRILDLNAIASDRDGGLHTSEDMRKLFEFGGIRLTSCAVRTLKDISRTPRTGRLRVCDLVIRSLHVSPVIIKNGQITSADILGAIEDLKLPTRVWLPLITPSRTEEPESQSDTKVA